KPRANLAVGSVAMVLAAIGSHQERGPHNPADILADRGASASPALVHGSADEARHISAVAERLPADALPVHLGMYWRTAADIAPEPEQTPAREAVVRLIGVSAR